MIKKKVLILGGGKSTEHEVSLVSAHNIFQNISSENYTALLVAVDKKGIWRHCEDLILDAGETYFPKFIDLFKNFFYSKQGRLKPL